MSFSDLLKTHFWALGSHQNPTVAKNLLKDFELVLITVGWIRTLIDSVTKQTGPSSDPFNTYCTGKINVSVFYKLHSLKLKLFVIIL